MTELAAKQATRVLGVEHTRPDLAVPAGACDCHVHVFESPAEFPFTPHRKYTPGAASTRDLIAHQNAIRMKRVVIVQPSPYGTDNSCLLSALRQLGDRARGVAVVDPSAPDSMLREFHAAGIRGLRINLETENIADLDTAGRLLEQAALRAAERGWHVQLYTNPSVVAALHERLSSIPAVLVLDHFAGMKAAEGADQPGFETVLAMLRSGNAYVKLSAPRRISNRLDYSDAGALARVFIETNPDRILWGSDWPHPGAWGTARDPEMIEPFHPVDDGRALETLSAWVRDGGTMRRILVDNPARLYGFGPAGH